MKLTGFLLLGAGWAIVLAAVVLLGTRPAGTVFIGAGLGVELLGLVLAVRGHLVVRKEHS